MIKPDAISKVEEIKKRIAAEGFEIVREKKTRFYADSVAEFYDEHTDKKWFPEFATFMLTGPVVAFELKRQNAIKHWRNVCGPTKTEDAKAQAPKSLRGLYGTVGNANANAVHGSDSPCAARRETDLVFANTFAMIKPDAVKAGNAEAIRKRIDEAGFEVVRERRFEMTIDQASSFYAEHKARDWFKEFTKFMTKGEVIALELSRVNAIKSWRSLMGPTSTVTAKQTAPNSIRALYGTPDNANANAVHGSDSPSSAAREIDLAFVQWGDAAPAKGISREADVDAADFLDFL